MKYLYDSRSKGLTYKQTLNEKEKPKIEVWTDSDWASDPVHRRNVSGYIVKYSSNLISFETKKQTLTAKSSFEAEYIALAFGLEQAMLVRDLVDFLRLPFDPNVVAYCDNQSTIKSYKSSSTK